MMHHALYKKDNCKYKIECLINDHPIDMMM